MLLLLLLLPGCCCCRRTAGLLGPVNGHKIKMLVYSGDDDSVCATLGTQQWIWDMGLPLKNGAGSEWQPWYLNSGPGCETDRHHDACRQLAGFATVWEGLSFATVHGVSGHAPL